MEKNRYDKHGKKGIRYIIYCPRPYMRIPYYCAFFGICLMAQWHCGMSHILIFMKFKLASYIRANFRLLALDLAVLFYTVGTSIEIKFLQWLEFNPLISCLRDVALSKIQVYS